MFELFPKHIPRHFIVLFVKFIPTTLFMLFLHAHLPRLCALFIFNVKADAMLNASMILRDFWNFVLILKERVIYALFLFNFVQPVYNEIMRFLLLLVARSSSIRINRKARTTNLFLLLTL